MKRISLVALLVFTVVFTGFFPTKVNAQGAQVKCGDVIKGELTKANQVTGYPILLAPHDKLRIAGQADGTSQIEFGITVDSPAGTRIFPRDNPRATSTPTRITGGMSAYGIHVIYVFNSDKTGAFQLSIGCELADGTIIAAGDTKTVVPTRVRPKTITLPIATITGTSRRLLQCGDVVAAEFTQNDQVHTFLLEMAKDDVSFQISVQPVGEGLWLADLIQDPTTKVVAGRPNNGIVPTSQLSVNPVIQGNYQIFIGNAMITDKGGVYAPGNKGYMGGIGIYTLTVSCTLKGNKIVTPDLSKLEQSSTGQAPSNPPASANTTAPAFDLAKLIKIPLVGGTPMSGAVTPTGSESFGYVIEGKANQTLSLSVTRLTGNLNLGITVLSEDGSAMLFQSNLLASKSATTQLTIPTDGKYLLAIYRATPGGDKAEATAFTVQAELKSQ